jgi:hypothetical protein
MTLAERLFRLTTSGVNVAPVFDGRTEYEPGGTWKRKAPFASVTSGLLLGAGEGDGDAGGGEEAGERDTADDGDGGGDGTLDLLDGVVVGGGAGRSSRR